MNKSIKELFLKANTIDEVWLIILFIEILYAKRIININDKEYLKIKAQNRINTILIDMFE